MRILQPIIEWLTHWHELGEWSRENGSVFFQYRRCKSCGYSVQKCL